VEADRLGLLDMGSGEKREDCVFRIMHNAIEKITFLTT
jgi:hypothetical protein